MSVLALTIADAVVTALNAATLSQSITFTREYVPKFDTANASTVQGKVVPKSDVREMGSAADDNATILVDIGVMKRLDAYTTAAAEKTEIDALLLLCEEIKAIINRERMGTSSEFVNVGTAQEIIYSVEEVDNGRVFLTAITASFATTVAV